jgi:NADPH2:quinone reductase
MKAICAHEWCAPQGLVIEDVERPEPEAGEVLIRVQAAALNFPDMLLIAGKYQVKPPFPFTPGMEVAGTLEKVGAQVAEFEPGQRVLAQTALGGFVQLLPDSMSDDEAAAFPLVYQTSYFGLAYRCRLQKGETVLVHSAAGGVGLAAVQIARALGAGKIIGTAGSDEKLDLIRKNGADIAINYRTEDFVETVNGQARNRRARGRRDLRSRWRRDGRAQHKMHSLRGTPAHRRFYQRQIFKLRLQSHPDKKL